MNAKIFLSKEKVDDKHDYSSWHYVRFRIIGDEAQLQLTFRVPLQNLGLALMPVSAPIGRLLDRAMRIKQITPCEDLSLSMQIPQLPKPYEITLGSGSGINIFRVKGADGDAVQIEIIGMSGYASAAVELSFENFALALTTEPNVPCKITRLRSTFAEFG